MQLRPSRTPPALDKLYLRDIVLSFKYHLILNQLGQRQLLVSAVTNIPPILRRVSSTVAAVLTS